MSHTCTRCGVEFEYDGNVKRCETCRVTCGKCGRPWKWRSDLCKTCGPPQKRQLIECRNAECSTMVRTVGTSKRTGYCRAHVDWSGHAARMAQFNMDTKSKPAELKFKTERIKSVPRTCIVCGAPFLATPGACRKGGGIVCGLVCQGVRAAQLTPKHDTDIERKIQAALERRGVPFQKQVPLCGVTVVDFLLPNTSTVIYCDGEFWHRLPEHLSRDSNQNEVLRANGYDVFRFAGARIHASADACVAEVGV